MIDLLASLLALLVIVVGLCLAGAAVSVVPLVTAVDMAERRGFSPDRWGAVSLLGIGLAAVLGALAAKHGLLLLLPAVLLPWVTVGLLARLSPLQRRVGGRAGTHE